MGNLEVEELLQLPTKSTKSKKELAFTEEEMIIKSMKEL
jgi:INO80 complex subunit B